jgi:hypothetical protein
MKRPIFSLVWLLLIALFSSPMFAANPTICSGPYALCAYAKCVPIPGETDKALCRCNLESGYSIGSKSCMTKDTIVDGYEYLDSRYFPVKKYVTCHNKRPWANCYNSKCVVDPQDNSKAFCTCDTVRDKGDYMYANDSCSTDGCDSGLISSYVVKDAVADFASLKTVSNYDKLPGYVPQACEVK